MIESSGLSRRFGNRLAVDGVDLAVSRGSSIALFGPNGAGKTTLLRMLASILRPTGGTYTIAGFDPSADPLEIRRRTGLISHNSYLYEDLTLTENLIFFGRMYGLPDPAGAAAPMLATIGLESRADDPVKTLSRGMTQRMSLARSLIHDPEIVFMDEPFSGLDPSGAALLASTLARLREEGRTIMLVTHDIRRGLEMSDSWMMMSEGRLVDQDRSEPKQFEVLQERLRARPRQRERRS